MKSWVNFTLTAAALTAVFAYLVGFWFKLVDDRTVSDIVVVTAGTPVLMMMGFSFVRMVQWTKSLLQAR